MKLTTFFLPILIANVGIAQVAPKLSPECKAADTIEASAHNTLSDAEKKDGWKLLFNGKDLSNFRNFKKPSTHKKWIVKDGAFTLTGGGGGDLITKEQYDAFEIKIDYNISTDGNSGLMYHVSEDLNIPWRTGPEVQIQDTSSPDPQKAGWLYALYPSKIDTAKPSGQWNTLHIIITPKKCVHYVNGTKYCEYVKGSKDWDAKVAASKFSKFPKFGKYTKGHICLQDHGNKVSFRNAKIRKLNQ